MNPKGFYCTIMQTILQYGLISQFVFEAIMTFNSSKHLLILIYSLKIFQGDSTLSFLHFLFTIILNITSRTLSSFLHANLMTYHESK